MRSLSIFLAILPLLLFPTWAAAEPNLAGKYQCVGTSAGGQQYRGTVEIEKVRAGYSLKWQVGQQKYGGIGFFDEDRLNVAWHYVTGNAVVTGAVSYKLTKDGKLVGKWVDPGLKAIYNETLVREADLRQI